MENQEIERLPDVFIIGAVKSGTTTLAHILSMHPDIFLGKKKEPDFFSSEENFAKGLDWYRENFKGAKAGQKIIDASGSYTRSPQVPLAPKRVHEFNPNAKLIYIMRNPVDRTYSHFVHRYSKTVFRNKPFEGGVFDFIENNDMHLCVDSSDYQLQIEQYLKYFDRSSMLFLFTEDLNKDLLGTIKKACDFLSVDYADHYFKDERQNVSKDFLETRVRIKITDSLKKFPLYTLVKNLCPNTFKQFLISLMGKLFYKKVVESYVPPKLAEDEKLRLLARFENSNQWIEKLTNTSLTSWYK